MNGVLIPANSGAELWFESNTLHRLHAGSTIEDQRLEICIKLMSPSKLKLYVELSPSMLLSEIEQAIRSNPSMTNSLTRIHGGHGRQYNFLHPMVTTNLELLVRDAIGDCLNDTSFSGVVLHCEGEHHLRPIAKAIDDPGTLILFARSRGVNMSLPQLRAWAQTQQRGPFERWLRDSTRAAYERMGAQNPKQPNIFVTELDRSGSEDSSAASFDPRPFAQQWRSDVAELVPTETFRYGPVGMLSKQSRLQQRIASISSSREDAAVAAILGAESNAGPDNSLLVREQTLADTCRIIERLDPSMLIVEWSVAATSFDTGLPSMLRSFAAMPSRAQGDSMTQVNPTDPAAQSIRVRTGTKDGHRYVSMISLASWTTEVDLHLSESIDWVLAGDRTETSKDLPVLQSKGKRVRVVLPPGQLAMLKTKSRGTDARIKSWTSRVSGGPAALDAIKQKVTVIAERIGTLSDFQPSNLLANGGFEQSGKMGLIGWMHAQHPPGCVKTDDDEYVEGKHSVQMTTDETGTTRTWLVSTTIDPPQSGRLAVSLYCRAELKRIRFGASTPRIP